MNGSRFDMPLPPIAVVGMGCRVPGADTVDEYWQLLLEGREAISEVPPEKWDAREIALERGLRADDEVMRWGGFLHEGDAFDPALFAISAREAQRMDPQQGLLLEVVWQALEHGGIAPSSLRLREVGVYVGISTCDFDRQLARNRAALDAGAATGTSYSICSNRISYTFGLRGPSLSIDAACSSSLVAIHLACQSLWTGETEMALAGGAHLILAPEKTLTLAAQGLLAADGRCKSFSERGNGYVRGEGAGILVLMPWESALRGGYRTLAQICGTAINHNGPSNGLSGPSGSAQQALIRAALARASVSPSQIGYVEAHGLGMRIGDEIELRAVTDVLAPGRTRAESIVVGSCKGNMGHLEAAAGVTAVIKAVLAARNGIIPKTLGAEPLNIKGFTNEAVHVASEQQAWPAHDTTRYAGVTSLSFGGANAHVVLKGISDTSCVCERRGTYFVLTLSAISTNALTVLARRYINFLTEAESNSRSFADVCFTAAVGRDHLPYRIAVVATNGRDAADVLSGLVSDGMTSEVAFQGQVSRRRVGPVRWIVRSDPTLHLQDAPEGMRSLYVQIMDDAQGALPAKGALTTLLSQVLTAPADIRIENASEDSSGEGTSAADQMEPWRFSTQDDAIVNGCLLMRVLARAHVTGRGVDWRRAFGPCGRTLLPIYPFERTRFWRTSALS